MHVIQYTLNPHFNATTIQIICPIFNEDYICVTTAEGYNLTENEITMYSSAKQSFIDYILNPLEIQAYFVQTVYLCTLIYWVIECDWN